MARTKFVESCFLWMSLNNYSYTPFQEIITPGLSKKGHGQLTRAVTGSDFFTPISETMAIIC